MVDKILDVARLLLFIVVGMTGYMLYEAWQKDHPAQQAAPAAAQLADAQNSTRFVPTAANTTPTVTTTTNVATPQASEAVTPPPPTTGKLVYVKTDVVQINIDTLGGDIVSSNLLAYPETLGSDKPFSLMTNQESNRYIAQSGLLSEQGPDTPEQQALYSTEQTSYEMQPNQNELIVRLTWTKPDNSLTVVKNYIFTRGSYEIKVGYEIQNHSNVTWTGNLYNQFARKDAPPAGNSGFISLATYFGAAISTPDKPFEKITFKQMKEQNLAKSIQGGWAAMMQHYFISAWIPDQNSVSSYYTRVLPNELYTVGMVGPAITVKPGATVTASTTLYTGPTLAKQMEKAAPHLDLTIDYGMFWFISVAILWMMQKIYDVIGNWGWAIVLVTIIIKALFYQLSAKSYRSMAALKRLQPKMEAIKERYKDDKQKLTQATMDLYRTEKVNPMSGCLPMLIQIPVFIALYWVLVESVQLRQAPFILWIHDLTQHDPYYILPVLMGISMFIQQRLNPPPPDPTQAKLMMLMPVIFTVLFANFPAGLMLYWFVNNTLSFLQQWYVMRHINK